MPLSKTSGIAEDGNIKTLVGREGVVVKFPTMLNRDIEYISMERKHRVGVSNKVAA